MRRYPATLAWIAFSAGMTGWMAMQGDPRLLLGAALTWGFLPVFGLMEAMCNVTTTRRAR